jgi:glucans biosynthesis protein C
MNVFPPPAAACHERLHGLDALRGGALLLGVVLHATMAWLPGAQHFWIAADAQSSLALGVLFWWIHAFRMLVFFLLAGFFGRLLCERLGARDFALDRWRRIALPLFVGWPLLFTAIVIVVVWGAWLKGGGSLPASPPPGPTFTPDDFPLAHLWFLWMLMLLYPAMLAWRALLQRLDPRDAVGIAADALLRRAIGPAAPLWFALPLALGLATRPAWYAWFGVPTPDQSLYPNLAALLAYGSAFGLGWLLQRQRALLERIARLAPGFLRLALVGSVACLGWVGVAPSLQPAPQQLGTVLYAIGYGIVAWSWTLALCGLALRHATRPSAWRRYLVDASYWIYLVHIPVVMALQVAATQVAAPWWVEFPLALVLALALLFGSYQVAVRGTWIGAWLAGRRRAAVVVAPAAADPV